MEEEVGTDDEEEGTDNVEGAKKILQRDRVSEDEDSEECEQLSADGDAHEEEDT